MMTMCRAKQTGRSSLTVETECEDCFVFTGGSGVVVGVHYLSVYFFFCSMRLVKLLRGRVEGGVGAWENCDFKVKNAMGIFW